MPECPPLVTNKNSASVSVFAIDDTKGIPQEAAGSPFAAGQAANGVARGYTGRFAFVNHSRPRQFFNPVPELISYRFDSTAGTA